MKSFLSVLLLLMVSLALAAPALAGTLTVKWSPPPIAEEAENVASYGLCYGGDITAKLYPDDITKYSGTGAVQGESCINVGNTLLASITLTPDAPTVTYVAVVAYDANGNPGPLSNQVSQELSAVGAPVGLTIVLQE